MQWLAVLPVFCGTLLSQTTSIGNPLRRAVEEQEHGDLIAAIAHYRRILRERPELTAALTNMAAALATLGRFDEAIGAYRKALKQHPEDGEIHKNLGFALYSKGDLNAAAPELRIAHQALANDERLALLLAECELRRGHAEDALDLLDASASRSSDDGNFLYLRGMALIRTGKPEKGVALVERYARRAGNPDALLLAGVTQLNLGSIAEARRDLDELVQTHPELPGALTWAGLAHDRAGDEDGAKELFRRALAADPHDFDANLHLGAVLFREKDYAAAAQPIGAAIRIQPDSPMAQYGNALLESARGKLEQAAADLEKIVRASPEWIEPHVKLSSVYFRLRRDADGRRERAMVDDLNAQHKAKGSPFEGQ